MSRSLARSRVIVTGASGAFGARTTDALRELGAEVVGLDLHEAPGVLACDITDPDQVNAAVGSAVRDLGGLDLLINCAGIGIPVDSGLMPGAVERSVVEVNLWGQWQTTAAALPSLLESGGQVVFVASGLAFATVPFAAAYAVSKRGLTAYADTLRMEYGERIRVSTVYPGFVPTPIHDASDEAGVNVGQLVGAETVEDIVATIISAATAERAPRDRGTTRKGHAELLAARHLPWITDRVIRGRFERLAADNRYDDSALVREHRARLDAVHRPAGDTSSVRTPDGAELAVRRTGSVDAATTIVFLHGWCLDSHLFDRQWSELSADPDLALVSVDLRGHGGSSIGGSDRLSIDQLADDLAAVLAVLAAIAPVGAVVPVGHSMGAMTIMALAERHPGAFSTISGAVLVNSAGGGLEQVSLGLPAAAARLVRAILPTEFGRRATFARLRGSATVRGRRSDAALAGWLLFEADPDPTALAYGRRLISTTDPETVARFYRSLLAFDGFSVLPELAGIPVEILSGTADRLLPASMSEELAGRLPGARLTVSEGAGHMLPLERPGLVTAAIRRVVGSVGAPTASAESHRASVGGRDDT